MFSKPNKGHLLWIFPQNRPRTSNRPFMNMGKAKLLGALL